MKRINFLAFALLLSVLLVSLTACGNPVKDDFKEYVNNYASKTYVPENNAIVKAYSDAVDTQDQATLEKALSETLPTMNKALIEKMKAYVPATPEVQELSNLYIKAAEIRTEGYALMLEALTTKTEDEAAMDAAVAKLGESDIKFEEFAAKAVSMKKDLGLVDIEK